MQPSISCPAQGMVTGCIIHPALCKLPCSNLTSNVMRLQPMVTPAQPSAPTLCKHNIHETDCATCADPNSLILDPKP